jgi:uroporphyrinogen decarboxylase
MNTGSIISPKFVKEHMHRYRRITDICHSHGVNAVIVDCDGYVDELMPLWLDSGINATYPLECAANNDAREYRKKYGKDLILFGNIDKRKLTKGKKEIDDELDKVRELIKLGGYFPGCDHHVPPDVPYENFKYLINELFQMNEDPELRRIIK